VIDLALPADIQPSITSDFNVKYVGMEIVQRLASENISYRTQALTDCEPIIEAGVKEFERLFAEREIERAMQSIPLAIREIKSTALGSVFAKDLEQLDENSREVLEKIIAYMEKKYISVPMKMAREVLLDAVARN
jgi:glutamyl-tRNA reductase